MSGPDGSWLRVVTTDPTPPYEQVRRQVAALIGTGGLRAGDRLPPVRQLAADLGLAAGTVARAYRELESAGLVVTRRGGGTRVAAAVRPPAAGRNRELARLAAGFVRSARDLGATDDELRAVLAEALGVPAGG